MMRGSRRAAAFCLLVRVFACASPAVAQAAERRCGWLENPTPGNLWLKDPDGTWIIATQGAAPPEGADLVGDMSRFEFVATNRSYGYGCACVEAVFEAGAKRVSAIRSVQHLPLRRCRGDAKLPPP